MKTNRLFKRRILGAVALLSTLLMPCVAQAAQAPADRLVLVSDGGHMMVVGEPQAKRVELPGRVSRLQMTPDGQFLYRDNATDEFIGLTGWLSGHLRDPKRLMGVICPAGADEQLRACRLSNKGDRVAWCFVNRDQKFGRLVISDLATGRVQYELKKPLVADAKVAFGQPAWSIDDQRLAVLYPQTNGRDDDQNPMAMLLGVDLSKNEARAILPEPFPLVVPTAHQLRFSPEGSHVMFPKGEPGPWGNYWPYIVSFDGQGLRSAKDVVYLDDGEHMVVDLKREVEPDGAAMSGTLRSVRTGKAEAVRFPLRQGVRGRAWSVDGSWHAQAHALPRVDVNELGRSVIKAVNTRTGEVHELMNVISFVDSERLLWVRY